MRAALKICQRAIELYVEQLQQQAKVQPQGQGLARGQVLAQGQGLAPGQGLDEGEGISMAIVRLAADEYKGK